VVCCRLTRFERIDAVREMSFAMIKLLF